jgi:hypothetical protein
MAGIFLVQKKNFPCYDDQSRGWSGAVGSLAGVVRELDASIQYATGIMANAM